jgi:hypothetical protein
LLLLHVPPTVASVSVVVDPRQIAVTPEIDAGADPTLIVVVVLHPPVVYVITAVPGVPPVITPVPTAMGATDGLLLLHVPPGTLLPSTILWPLHVPVGPVIVPGIALIVIVRKAGQPDTV